MQPYVMETLAAERVRSLHQEAAARRLARAARAARAPAGRGLAVVGSAARTRRATRCRADVQAGHIGLEHGRFIDPVAETSPPSFHHRIDGPHGNFEWLARPSPHRGNAAFPPLGEAA
jgi:hypothetical protein